MKRINKSLFLAICLCGMLLPLTAKASSSISISCAKTTIEVDEITNCSLTATSDNYIGGITLELSATGLSIDEIEANKAIWHSTTVVNNKIAVADISFDSNHSYSIKNGTIATFKVKGTSVTNGNITATVEEFVNSEGNQETVENRELPITVKAKKSTVNTLQSLTVNGTGVSGFSSSQNNYTVNVDGDTSSVEIGAILNDNNASMSELEDSYKLHYGTNVIKITVTSESGKANVYTLTINRPEVRTLKTLKVNDSDIELEDGKYEYRITVDYTVTNLDIDAELQNEGMASFIDEYGSRVIDKIKVGNNEFLIKIADEDDDELVYKLIVNRLNKDGVDTTSEKNNDTGVRLPLVIILIALSSLTAGFMYLKKKNYFKQI